MNLFSIKKKTWLVLITEPGALRVGKTAFEVWIFSAGGCINLRNSLKWEKTL